MTAPARIVLTRSREQCGPWARALAAAGVESLTLPLLRFRPLPPPADLDPSGWDWLLFTSPQAVRAFRAAGLAPGRARVGALGAGTTAELHAHDLRDHLGAAAADGAALARAFVARVRPPARVLLPGAERRLPEPRASLAAAGFEVAEAPLYRTEAVPPAELPADPWRPGDLIFFASPSAARACAAAWGAPAPCVAIGATTAAAARDAGFATAVAARPDLRAMVEAAGLDPSTVPEPQEA